MENIDAMRVFVRVVESGSMAAAGRHLGLSPASVTRRIVQLEEEAGSSLLHRSSRKLSLTTVGQLYYARVVAILEQLSKLKNEISEASATPSGLLTIHSRSSVGRRFLSQVVINFLKAFPLIKVRLWLSEDVPDLIDYRIDVAIRLGQPHESGYAMRRLTAGVEPVLFASPSYLAQHPPIRTPADLIHHSCLTGLRKDTQDNGEGIWRYRDEGGEKELAVKGRLQVSDGWTLIDAVTQDLGIGLLPGWMVADDMRAGRLRRVLPNIDMTPLTFDAGIYAVFSKTPQVAPNVRVFVDFLVQWFKINPSIQFHTYCYAIPTIPTHGRCHRQPTRWR